MRSLATRSLIYLALLAVLGCGQAAPPPSYDDGRGFAFTPPLGWVERARDSAASAARRAPQGKGLPLPALDGPGRSPAIHMRARYDRVTAGRLAWLRLATTEAPASTPLSAFLRAPPGSWRRDGAEESLEVGGQPAARASFVGKWDGKDYRCETTAVRHAGRVYLITASFPADDSTAREQVRAAVMAIAWR